MDVNVQQLMKFNLTKVAHYVAKGPVAPLQYLYSNKGRDTLKF